jgi:mono/diheme cytochrome c family protein
MRSILFLLLAAASLWVIYLGVRERPARLVVPQDHVHTPAASRGDSGGEAASPAATVTFDTSSPGYAVYRERGCQTCHGADGLGSRMGPSLASARLHYDRASLTTYLQDPDAAIAGDERLLELQARFPRVQMPAVPADLSEADLQALLGFVLEPVVR